MSVNHIKSTLGTQAEVVTPVLLGDPSTKSGSNGFDVTIQNLSSTSNIYIGGEGVSASSFGYKIPPGGAWSVELKFNDKIYAISDAESVEYCVLSCSLESYNG